MQLTTEEKLKLTCEMRVPQIVELLDMSETTHQKVRSWQIRILIPFLLRKTKTVQGA